IVLAERDERGLVAAMRRRGRLAGDRELQVARDEVTARERELARRAIEAAGDLTREIEIMDFLVRDQRVADVEAGQVKAAGEPEAGAIDLELQAGVDRRALVVDDRGMREDRREPIELEFRGLELDRRGDRRRIEIALRGP